MQYAGIDFSSIAIDIALIDIDTRAVRCKHILLPHKTGWDAFDRTRRIRSVMPPRSAWEDEGVLAVGIEEPRGQSAGVLYRVQGGILACLPPNLAVEPFGPNVWRARLGMPAGGRTEALKRRSRERAMREGADESWSTDQCEALLMALAVEIRVQASGVAA